jgi:hypothetical protein
MAHLYDDALGDGGGMKKTPKRGLVLPDHVKTKRLGRGLRRALLNQLLMRQR